MASCLGGPQSPLYFLRNDEFVAAKKYTIDTHQDVLDVTSYGSRGFSAYLPCYREVIYDLDFETTLAEHHKVPRILPGTLSYVAWQSTVSKVLVRSVDATVRDSNPFGNPNFRPAWVLREHLSAEQLGPPLASLPVNRTPLNLLAIALTADPRAWSLLANYYEQRGLPAAALEARRQLSSPAKLSELESTTSC